MEATDRRGDDAASEAFVAGRSVDLLRTAVLLTRDRGHAEDLLQTALVKAYRRWNRIDGDPYPYVAAPAGTALTERLLAIASAGALTVNGPATGVIAEVLLADGSTLTSFSLPDGAARPPSRPRSREHPDLGR